MGALAALLGYGFDAKMVIGFAIRTAFGPCGVRSATDSWWRASRARSPVAGTTVKELDRARW